MFCFFTFFTSKKDHNKQLFSSKIQCENDYIFQEILLTSSKLFYKIDMRENLNNVFKVTILTLNIRSQAGILHASCHLAGLKDAEEGLLWGVFLCSLLSEDAGGRGEGLKISLFSGAQ